MQQQEVSKNTKSIEELLTNLKDIYSKDELDTIRNAWLQAKSLTKAEAKLIRPIVPIREWVNSPYYVGGSVNTLYPYWKQALIDVYEAPQRVNQLILTGAQGAGKTTFALLVILRRIYELSCYENVARLFNLDNISKLAFAYLSVTKDQAMNSGFSKLTEWIDDIPYFQEHFKRNPGIDSSIIWPDARVWVTVGSRHNHFIGLDMIGAILDEANFREMASATKDNDYNVNQRVLNLYSQLMTRAQTRFVVGGTNYSLIILVSSTTHVGSFTESVISQYSQDPHTRIYSPALWDVKPKEYKKDRFLVFAGGNNVEPRVIKSMGDINLILQAYRKPMFDDGDLSTVYERLPNEIKPLILKVPEEHRSVFELNITEGLQSLAGYSVASISKFFSNKEAFDRSIKSYIEEPFTKQEIILSTTDNSFEDGYQPINFYLKPNFKFRNPSAPRFMHLDLALSNDSVGISMAHISGHKPLYQKQLTAHQEKYGDEIEYDSTLPIVGVDFMLRIKPPKKPHRISIPKIRDFIIYLKQVLGVNIALVTADQFQSAQLLQELSEFGIKTENLSVDRTPEPYNTLANMIDEGRFETYRHDYFEKELFGLISFSGGKKIDHPPKESKDVADSVAGSVYNTIKAADKSDTNESTLMDLFIKTNKSNKETKDYIEKALNDLTNILKNN